MVGMPGFEPGASTSRTWRAAKLRYIPLRGGSVPQADTSASGALGLGDHEAVPHPGLGQQQLRGRRVVERLAQVGHVDPEILGLLAVAGAPDPLQQEAVGAEPAGVDGQGLDQPVLGRGQPYLGAALVTSLASRSMATSPAVMTRGRSDPAARAWRSATRILAISSATPNGLVT
jgi:hypothetical protein